MGRVYRDLPRVEEIYHRKTTMVKTSTEGCQSKSKEGGSESSTRGGWGRWEKRQLKTFGGGTSVLNGG